MSQTTTTFDDILKIKYDNQTVAKLAYKNRPALGTLTKKTDFTGKSYPLPFAWSNGGNISSLFANAQSSGYVRTDAFFITRKQMYGVARLDNEVLLASVGDKGAFETAVDVETTGRLQAVSNLLESYIFGDGTGKLGAIGASTVLSTTTCSLASPEDSVHFEAGMVLEAGLGTGSVVRGPGVPGASTTNKVTVQRVDRDAGILYFDVAMDSFTGDDYVVGDNLYNVGDYNNVISGFGAWLPSTAPGATAFFGVDRSVDSRLGGLRVGATDASSIQEAINKGAQRVVREGGQPDMAFINPSDFETLVNELSSKVIYSEAQVKGEAKFGFKSIKFVSAAGEIDIIPAPKCPKSTVFLLDSSTWVLLSLGQAPMMLKLPDGTISRWVDALDRLEYRIGSYLNLGCKAPGWNCRITLPNL